MQSTQLSHEWQSVHPVQFVPWKEMRDQRMSDRVRGYEGLTAEAFVAVFAVVATVAACAVWISVRDDAICSED